MAACSDSHLTRIRLVLALRCGACYLSKLFDTGHVVRCTHFLCPQNLFPVGAFLSY
jgi:hypothetical protein